MAQEEGMQTPVPLPSHSFYKGMGAEWCAHPPPLHGLPFAHYPEEGVSTTPCVVPRAQLLHYCRNVRPTWVKFDSKDTKESEWCSRF